MTIVPLLIAWHSGCVIRAASRAVTVSSSRHTNYQYTLSAGGLSSSDCGDGLGTIARHL